MKRFSKHSAMICFTGGLGILLVLRLFSLTVVFHDKWSQYTSDASQRTVYETAARGDILDRNGRLLAGSLPVYSAEISSIGLDEKTAEQSCRKLFDILESYGEETEISSAEDLMKKIFKEQGVSGLPVEVCRGISSQAAAAIQEKKPAGVRVRTDYKRYYPYGHLASHVIGYTGSITSEEYKKTGRKKGYRKDSRIGRAGIEKYCESSLKGTDGATVFQVDASGSARKVIEKKSSEKGSDVRLTIDAKLQQTAEKALQQAVSQSAAGGTFASRYGDVKMTYAPNAAVGAAVVMDVKTGEVLALANTPDFDPNDFTADMSQEKWASLQQQNQNDPMSPAPLYNVATMTAVQPGSAFKPVTALAAMSCGLDPERSLYDDGYVDLGGRRFGCSLWNETGGKHGYVDLAKAVEVSCNYYFYDIASGKDLASGRSLGYKKAIDNSTIVKYAKLFGLGSETGIETGESTGLVPSEELKNQGIKSQLRSFLLGEDEKYFTETALRNRKQFKKKIEKIVNWADKDLSLKEIMVKLNNEKIVRKEKLEELAGIYYQNYYSQMGWSTADTFNIAIGQGDNAYTVLQMANYMAVLGNEGQYHGATLIADRSRDKGRTSSEKGQLDKADIRTIISSMTRVTEGSGGTLHSVFAGFPYRVAAKSGTAQRAGKISDMDEKEYLRRYIHLIAPGVTLDDAVSEAGRLMKAYPDVYSTEDAALRRAVMNLSSRSITADDIDRYKKSYDAFAWTVALAPADDPQIAVAVMLVQGRTSVNAAPVARELIGKYGEMNKWEK